MNSSEEELNELRQQLKEKNRTIESNNKLIEKLMKENDISLKYNNELRDELKLLSAKLYLHQNIVRSGVTSSVAIQTDHNLAKDDVNFCVNCKKLENSCDKSQDLKDWKQNNMKNAAKISDLVREIAEEVTQKNDFENDYLYDEKSKAYYSRSTGWYYYPESLLFYDPKSKNYYKYDSEKKKYNFHSTLKEMNKTRQKFEKNSTFKKRKVQNKETDSKSDDRTETIEVSSEEEGEIADSDGVSIISDDTDCSLIDAEEEKSKSCPPMVRMIVKESTTLQIGSLLLVTCMGAKVGNDSNCDLYITDESVSRSHAEIRYDYDKSHYVMRDLNSTNGTFANGHRVRSDSEAVLKHCDEIGFGKCVLLVHIHWGKDVTCDRCEPGLVIASFASNQTTAGFYSQEDREKDRKKRLKYLKKKYGLKDADFVESNAVTNRKYQNRAEQRRTEKGSDNPYEKTAAGTSLDTALSESNKGFQMLSKMGWTSGQALGRQTNGIVEPINVINPDLQQQTTPQTER